MNELKDLLEWFACNTHTFIIKDESERIVGRRTHNTQLVCGRWTPASNYYRYEFMYFPVYYVTTITPEQYIPCAQRISTFTEEISNRDEMEQHTGISNRFSSFEMLCGTLWWTSERAKIAPASSLRLQCSGLECVGSALMASCRCHLGRWKVCANRFLVL